MIIIERTKIALVQMESSVNDIKSNLKKIEYYIKKSHENKVNIISFPEATINGYSKDTDPIRPKEKLEIYSIIKKLAIDYSITILVGFIEENTLGKPYITHLVATPNGQLAFYRKSHLGESEVGCFSSGDKLPIFKTSTATIGIQICWETHFPEISGIMALKGADIIFTPFASPVKASNRKDIWLKYLAARAYDNSIFIAACNSVGTNGKGTTFGGGLLVLDPKGNLIEEDFNGEESILFIDLDPSLINDIKNKNNKSMKFRYYMDHRRPELYKKIIE